MVQYGRKCLLCKNTRKREPGCRLFKFPARGTTLWYRWLEACGLRETDIDLRSREPPRLCQRHFQKKDFLTRQLTGMAVPSVFPITVYTEVEGGTRNDEGPSSEQVTEELLSISQDEMEFSEIVTEESIGSGDRESETRDEETPVSEELDQEQICTVDQHRTLMEKLQSEQRRVESLSRELEAKNRIISEQFELLKQLGVQMVTFTESH
ncbi:AAEL011589-PA [Aedes aegypti]|uniref:AAEL011589-PA n=1 Tax=Aedes aegypti TaxID=7159 RepID=Q16PM7_AEDAE|nr:AAEL011589-PA [Aedes aegypti]